MTAEQLKDHVEKFRAHNNIDLKNTYFMILEFIADDLDAGHELMLALNDEVA